MAQQYELIFNNPAVISWAKKVLKKSARIVWYLKKIKEVPHLHPVKELEHYFSMNIAKIENFHFREESIHQVLLTFKELEEEYLGKLSSDKLILAKSSEVILLEFPDGLAWVNLKKPSCDEEAQAMGHCGNQGGNKDAEVLSLRKKVVRAGKTYWKPHLTFILEKNGCLGEMKGRQNEKPHQKYHSHILELLKLPMIKGIDGEGYLPENNFRLQDLSQESLQEFLTYCPNKISVSEMSVINHRTAEEFLKFNFSESSYKLVKRCLDWITVDEELYKIYQKSHNQSVQDLAIRQIKSDDLLLKIVYNKYDDWFLRESAATALSEEQNINQVINYLRDNGLFQKTCATHRELVDKINSIDFLKSIIRQDCFIMSEGHYLIRALEKIAEEDFSWEILNKNQHTSNTEIVCLLKSPKKVISIIANSGMSFGLRQAAFRYLWIGIYYRQEKKLSNSLKKGMNLSSLPTPLFNIVINGIKDPFLLNKMLKEVTSKLTSPREIFAVSKRVIDQIQRLKSPISMDCLNDILNETANEMVKCYLEYQLSNKDVAIRDRYEDNFVEIIQNLSEYEAGSLVDELFISPNNGYNALKKLYDKVDKSKTVLLLKIENGLKMYEAQEANRKMFSEMESQHISSFNSFICGQTGRGPFFG